MRRQTILAIWIGGFVLAALLYVIGPDRFFDGIFNAIDAIDTAFRNMLAALGAQVYGVIRALAIAIYVVFLVLGFGAARRGLRASGTIVTVTIIFMILVWKPWSYTGAPLSRWLAALAVVVAGAIVMTQRLTGTPRQGPPPPYPPGGRY